MNGKNKTFISIREASQICGIKSQTLRKMADANKIVCYRTPSGQRKFDLDSLEKMFSVGNERAKKERATLWSALKTGILIAFIIACIAKVYGVSWTVDFILFGVLSFVFFLIVMPFYSFKYDLSD